MANLVEISVRKKKRTPWTEAKVSDGYDRSDWFPLDEVSPKTPAMLALCCLINDATAQDILWAAEVNRCPISTPWGDIPGHEVKAQLEEAKKIRQAQEQSAQLQHDTPVAPQLRSGSRL